ncbi:MAG: hypothetical protein ACMG6E_10630, partial [Candidatus Roizmanbacteria bacterium]
FYCNDDPSSTVKGCPTTIPDQLASGRFKTIKDFTVDCGVHLTYGWVVAQDTTPPPNPNPNTKQSYQLDLMDPSGDANDVCYLSADINNNTYAPAGSDHCKSAMCKTGSTINKIIVDYKNIGSSEKSIDWQQNACNGKNLGELDGISKNECNDYVNRKTLSARLPSGSTYRCIWDSPVSKSSPNTNSEPRCDYLKASDSANPEDACTTSGSIANPTPIGSGPLPSSGPTTYVPPVKRDNKNVRILTTTYIMLNHYGKTSTPVSIEDIFYISQIGSEKSDIGYINEKVKNDTSTSPTYQFTSWQPLADPVPASQYQSELNVHIKFGSTVLTKRCVAHPNILQVSKNRSIRMELIITPDGKITCDGTLIGDINDPTVTPVAPTSISSRPSTAPAPSTAPSSQACERVAGSGNWGIGFITDTEMPEDMFTESIDNAQKQMNMTNLGGILSNFSFFKVLKKLPADTCIKSTDKITCKSDIYKNMILNSTDGITKDCPAIKSWVYIPSLKKDK